MKALVLFIIIAFAAPVVPAAQTKFFRISEGSIRFLSEAPLERIEARSTELEGLIDPAKGSFAFAVPIRSFQGFNGPLQREHFNENYLESDKFPKATFSGKIIEAVDFTRDGRYEIRAKGKLNIHGREQERIIRSELVIEQGKLRVIARFSVLLQEHDIAIPRIVNQKIAEEIQVEIRGKFE